LPNAGPGGKIDYLKSHAIGILDLDRVHRAWFSMRTFCQASDCSRIPRALDLCRKTEGRLKAAPFGEAAASGAAPELEVPGGALAEEVRDFFDEQNLPTPFPLAASLWWGSYALVKMQPVAAPRAAGE